MDGGFVGSEHHLEGWSWRSAVGNVVFPTGTTAAAFFACVQETAIFMSRINAVQKAKMCIKVS